MTYVMAIWMTLTGRVRPASYGRVQAREPGSAADGVALHAARVRRGVQHAAAAGHGAHPAERPGRGHVDVVPAAAQFGDDVGTGAFLDVEGARRRLTRVEGGREVPGVELGRVDGLLHVHAEVHVIEE